MDQRDGNMTELDGWWKNAVIHGVDVEGFCDSDGNGGGMGDFPGLCAVALRPCGLNGHAEGRATPCNDNRKDIP